MTNPADARPPLAVSSIILSMALVAISNGLLFAYVPVKLATSGFAPWVADTNPRLFDGSCCGDQTDGVPKLQNTRRPNHDIVPGGIAVPHVEATTG